MASKKLREDTRKVRELLNSLSPRVSLRKTSPEPPKETRTAPVALRVFPSVKDALEEAAKRERRTLSAMAEIILTEWLTSKGFLGEAPDVQGKLETFSKDEIADLVRAYYAVSND